MTNATQNVIETTHTMIATWPVVAQLICGFLGGGFVAAAGNWLFVARSERTQRQIAYLQQQLRELYGPLHFWAIQNQQLIKVHKQHDEAYKKEYIDQKWAGTWLKDESGKTQPEKDIGVMNEYADRIRKNHARMLEILEKNWSLIDQDDCEMFARFMVDRARYEIEFDDKGILKPSLDVYQHIGDGTVYTYRGDFIDQIHRKWDSKQNHLQSLLHLKGRCSKAGNDHIEASPQVNPVAKAEREVQEHKQEGML